MKKITRGATVKYIWAKSAVIDHVDRVVTVDGIPIPWHLGENPTIEKDGELPILRLSLEIFINGTAVVRTSNGKTGIVDPVLGDVGAYGRRMARERFAEAFPWLHIPEEPDTLEG